MCGEYFFLCDFLLVSFYPFPPHKKKNNKKNKKKMNKLQQQTRRISKTPKLAPLIALTFLLTIPLYYPFHTHSPKNLPLHNTNDNSPCSGDVCGGGDAAAAGGVEAEQCDLFSGEWVPDPDGPYYTNETCYAIQEHQDCMKFGRPDLGFLKWRWKPDDCQLALFDPRRFLELVRGKSLAFVGDSVARNHMQSLICLLAKVAYPSDVSLTTDENKRYTYTEFNFNISIFWSPYLVKTGKLDNEPFDLYLDEFDPSWTTQISHYDYVIISAGHWFFRPTYFHLENRRVGCLYCPEAEITHLTPVFSYRRAFRTAFRGINGGAAAGSGGVTFLRTFAPSHFEGGGWNSGGNCTRTRPFRRNETVLEGPGLEFYMVQLEELGIAQRAGKGTGGKFRLFDATKVMLLRPDGHPSRYGHWPGANRVLYNDCVHWCLPGPIDSWNDFLQELLMRELGDV